jgi:hypothetical protein
MHTLTATTAFLTASALTLGGVSGVYAQEKSAAEIAKGLANPASSLASISTSLQYTTYDGDLPRSGDQDSLSFVFQPVVQNPFVRE